ncbi:hypothetical protein GCM10027440_23900 [Nocardiopsis coralliicola]
MQTRATGTPAVPNAVRSRYCGAGISTGGAVSGCGWGCGAVMGSLPASGVNYMMTLA